MAATFPPTAEMVPTRQSARRGVAALLLGLLALAAFVLLVLPTDLILFDLSGILQPIAQMLSPLALGPEILFSPVALVIAIAAIIVARRGLRGWSGQAVPGTAATRAGLALGWITIACCVVSLGLMILSFLGVLKHSSETESVCRAPTKSRRRCVWRCMMNVQGISGRALVRLVLGIVVPLACGVAYFPVVGPLFEAIGPTVGSMVDIVQVGVLLLVGALGGLLLRTWLAPFVVPISFIVGLLPVQVINLVRQGGSARGRIYPEDVLFLLAFVVLALVLLAVGAVVVVAPIEWRQWRQRRRAARQSQPFPQTAPLISPREEREREPMTPR